MTDVSVPDAVKRTIEGAEPSVIATCSKSGVPNVTFLSKVYYVDEQHLALSYQFFNKTVRNIQENPRVALQLIDQISECGWQIDLVFDRAESDGPIFDEMDMAIEAIASMTGMSGVFKLKAAHIYKVVGLHQVPFSK